MKISSIQKQEGAALGVGLILLVIITLMGYSGMKGTMLQEKMAAGLHNRSLSNTGANSGLRAGETFLYNLVEVTNGVNVTGTPTGSFNKIYSYLSDPEDYSSGVNPIIEAFQERNWVSSSGTTHDFDFMTVHQNAKLMNNPQYLIYELPKGTSANPGSTEFGSGSDDSDGQKPFIVVGKSDSGDGKSFSLISSLYTVVASSTATN